MKRHRHDIGRLALIALCACGSSHVARYANPDGGPNVHEGGAGSGGRSGRERRDASAGNGTGGPRDAALDATTSHITPSGAGGSVAHAGSGGHDASMAGGGGSIAHAGSGGRGASMTGTGGSMSDAGSGGHDAGDDDDAGPHGGVQGATTCHAPMTSASTRRTCPNKTPVPLALTLVAGRLSSPVFLTYAPGDPDKRLFVVEQSGQIQIIQDGSVLTTPFLDLSASVLQPGDDGPERGLLGLAFDPDYEATGRFWVNYTAASSGPSGMQTVVESYRVSADRNVADPSTQQPLIAFEQPEANHNGGMLAFGPDSCLYIGSGDGGGFGGDDHASALCPYGNGQCLDTELGKILRVDVDRPQMAAPGNITGSSVPHIWDYGLRNPWRFSFDRATGDLYIGDVGERSWEEIDVELGGTGHKNYGWRITEGKHCMTASMNDPDACSDHGTDYAYSGFAAPAYDYPHVANDDACVIGGYVYRGENIPSLRGYYVFADWSSGRIRAVAWDGSELCGPPIDLALKGWGDGRASFGEDADGELYVVGGASVYRIVPR